MPSSAPLRRHTTRFASIGNLQVAPDSAAKEIYASLDRLKGLLPADIDPKEHETVLYVVGNLMVGGTVNKNDDAMTVEDTLRVFPRFEGQFIDIEHNRGTVVGRIVKAGLSELGTDRLITVEEARAANKPFNLAIVIAIWKVVDRDLCNYIIRASQPGSPDRDKLSFSFEVGFDDYDVIVLPKGASNLSQVTKIITPDMGEFDRWDKMLRCNGGKGIYGDKNERVARVLVGNILPLGGGIVANPAAAVKGLAPVLTSPHVDPTKSADAGMYTHSLTQVTLNSTDAARYQEYAASIPDDHLYNGEGEVDSFGPKYGREDSPHVTALYGLTSADAEPIRALLANFGPITMTMGKVSAFQRDEKAYDVLKVDVASDSLHRLNDLLRSSLDYESDFPDYIPHCTIGYLGKGLASQYIGDTRFEGHSMTFNSLSFRPHTGDPVDIPLTSVVPQTDPAQVYSNEDDIMAAQPSRFIKLPAGLQDALANMRLPVTGGDPLVNGVNVTLSDGRVLKNVKIFDGKTLELDKELSMEGVVVTSMTPGMPPQNDDGKPIHPHAGDSYPVVTPESQQKQDVQTGYKEQGIMGPYTDASAKDGDKPYGDVQYADPGYQDDKKQRYPIDTEEHIRAAWSYINQEKNASQYSAEQVKHIKSKIVAAWKKKIDPAGPESAKASAEEIVAAILKLLSEQTDFTNTCVAGVSSVNPPSISMNLDEIKQAIASVTSVDELKTAVANSQFFADVIAKASEKMVQERDAAKAAATQTEASLKDIQTELVALRKAHDEAVAAQQAAAAESLFNDRMAAVEEVFAFDDDTRAELVSEIKACADDEAFSKWMTKAKKLYKGWTKAENIVERKDGKDKKDAEPDADEDDAACASAAKTALASAQSNPVDAPIANDLGDLGKGGKTIEDKMREVMGSAVSIGGKDLNSLTEEANKTVRRTR